MLKQSLNIVKNLFFNRHLSGSFPDAEKSSFSLSDAVAWKDVFGSNEIDSIFKYYRSFAYSCINARAENVFLCTEALQL